MTLETNISFNQPFFSGNETNYMKEISTQGNLSVNEKYLKKCKSFFKSKYNFKHCFLTPSCTYVLEMSALLLGIMPRDEVIFPAYNVLATANAFILRGATIFFCDNIDVNPNIDIEKLETLIMPRTKLIVPIHYGGSRCDIERLMEIAGKHSVKVVEDAAQAINVFVKLKDGSKKALRSFGDFSTFSFHHTKNMTCGAGGMLVVNNAKYTERAYEWTSSTGSSYLMSEINAAYLFSAYLSLILPPTSLLTKIAPNYHVFHLKYTSLQERAALITFMDTKNVRIAFHYQSLHRSKYFKEKYTGAALTNADNYSGLLVRLPVYYDLTDEEIQFISNCILEFYAN